MFCLIRASGILETQNEVNMSERKNVMSGREEITIDSLFVNDEDEHEKIETKCINEKLRREQENVYIEELARLVSTQLADIHSFSVRPDRCIILQESLEQMKLLKTEETESEVSSSNASKFGPIFLEALEGFLLVINQSAIIDFVSENVSNFLGQSQNDLIKKPVYTIIHNADQNKLNSYLTGGALSENETMANIGRRTRTFNLRVMANSGRYERMSFVSVLMPFPRENDDENCLICVVRRVALNLNKTIDQFSTRLSARGEILTLDVTGVASIYSDILSQHLIGKKVMDLVHPSDVGKFTSHLKQVLNSNISISSELYRLRLLDDDCFIRIQSKSRRYQQDAILAVHSVCREPETSSTTSMFNVSVGPSLSPPVHQSNDFSLNDCLGLNELYPSSSCWTDYDPLVSTTTTATSSSSSTVAPLSASGVVEQTHKLRNLLTDNNENILRDLLHSDPGESQDGGNNMLRKLLNDDDKSFRKEENKRKSMEQEDNKATKRVPPAAPQQLAGQNPMLASMLAQTPKTLPAAPISIPTSIVSQVPQERLPKNLEKKLIHTPANQLLCIGSTSSSSSISSSHIITTATGGGIVSTSIQPPLAPRKNSAAMLKSFPPFLPNSPQNSTPLMSTLPKISPSDDSGPSDPLLSVILEDVWSLQQEMNNIDSNESKRREMATPTPPASLSIAPSPPVLAPTPPMATPSNQRSVLESSSDSMLYQILDDVILDPAPPNVVIPSSPPDLNDKLAISAIQRELMSLESSGNFFSNNNLGPPPAYSQPPIQHAPSQQMQAMQPMGMRPRQTMQPAQRPPFPAPVSPQGFPPRVPMNTNERMKLMERRKVQMVNLQQQQRRLLAQQQQQQLTMQTPQEPTMFPENMNEILNNSIAPNVALQIKPRKQESPTTSTASYPSSPASFASRSFPLAWPRTSSPSPPPAANRMQQQNPMLNAQLSTNGYIQSNNSPGNNGGLVNSNNDGSNSAPPIPRRAMNNQQRFSFPSPTSTPPASFPLFDTRPSIRQELRAVVGARSTSSSHLNDGMDASPDFFAELVSSPAENVQPQQSMNMLTANNGNKKSLLQKLLSEPP